MKLNRIATSALLVGLILMSAAMPQADAWPFKKKPDPAEEAAKKVQTYEPPPTDAIATHCEPIRQKIVKINRSGWFGRTIQAPRRSVLLYKHNQCKDEFMTQEFEYLKHVDIQQPPSLPKLKTDAQPAAKPQAETPAAGETKPAE